MDSRTTHFLKSRFQSYYKNADIGLPDNLPSREWAFIFYDDMPEKTMHRHKSFGSPGEVLDYLYGMAPAHVYNSTAYYEYPDAKKMNEKNWLGAELIFDLDADHLPNVPRNYPDMLELVKKEASKLMDFLLDDFGFSAQEIELVFSGGRGYHFHIMSPKVLRLESSERREIVNYVGGRDLEVSYLFTKVAMSGDVGTGSTGYYDRIRSVPLKWKIKNSDSGWGKRFANYLVEYLKTEVSTKKYKKDMFNELKIELELGSSSIKTLIKLASNESALNDISTQGRLDFPAKDFKRISEYIMQQSIKKFGINFGASVDEPVTADIKRLIRVPGTLHGGSGMLVKKLALSELEKFDPLEDAVVFGEKPVKITVSKPFSVQMKGRDLRMEEGIQEVPEYAAVYLICRGVAEYGHRRNQPGAV